MLLSVRVMREILYVVTQYLAACFDPAFNTDSMKTDTGSCLFGSTLKKRTEYLRVVKQMEFIPRRLKYKTHYLKFKVRFVL